MRKTYIPPEVLLANALAVGLVTIMKAYANEDTERIPEVLDKLRTITHNARTRTPLSYNMVLGEIDPNLVPACFSFLLIEYEKLLHLRHILLECGSELPGSLLTPLYLEWVRQPSTEEGMMKWQNVV